MIHRLHISVLVSELHVEARERSNHMLRTPERVHEVERVRRGIAPREVSSPGISDAQQDIVQPLGNRCAQLSHVQQIARGLQHRLEVVRRWVATDEQVEAFVRILRPCCHSLHVRLVDRGVQTHLEQASLSCPLQTRVRLADLVQHDVVLVFHPNHFAAADRDHSLLLQEVGVTPLLTPLLLYS